MSQHPFGWLSVLPPVAAIVLAIFTRRIVLSLLAGVLVGALVLTWDFSLGWWGAHPFAAVQQATTEHLWATLVLEEKLSIFAFTLVMGAMVGVISRAAGMRGLVDVVSPWASNRRRGQLTAWVLGLFVFFDDYANTMLLGHTLRPLTDRLKISREKLAYLVDSTAAPVSGMALISTWVAGEIDYVDQGLQKLPADLSLTAIDLFIRSIPYRFYVIWALLFVPLVAWFGRDFGPMWRAERRAMQGDPIGVSSEPSAEVQDVPSVNEPQPHTPARWYNAVIPILVTVIAIASLMYVSGKAALLAEDPQARLTLANVFGNCDAMGSLLWGSLFGFAAAALLVSAQRLLSSAEILDAARRGAGTMAPALLILWMASALSSMTGNEANASDAAAESQRSVVRQALEQARAPIPPQFRAEVGEFPHRRYRLYTGSFLGGLLESRIQPALLPTVVFLLAAAVAFSTGTSWGTMGVLMPLVIDLTYRVLVADGVGVTATQPILLGCIGSVLAGAIFGDHCSPISDTTVMSSQSCGCNHLAHVSTQMPYALAVAAIAVVFGALPIGYGAPPWLLLPLGVAAMVGVLLLFGRPVEDAAPQATEE